MAKKKDIIDVAPENVTVVEDKPKKMIEVTQLPVIEEHLQDISSEILTMVSAALELPATDETLKAVKDSRTKINKKFTELETQRKGVKNKILAPYDEFEKLYKKYITQIVKGALSDLDSKIEKVTSIRKEEKRNKALEYFEEYRNSKGIDFIKFDDVGLSITLSISDKKLREACAAYVDKVVEDLALIETQEHKEEILYEYKISRNVSHAINSVVNRHKAIEEEKRQSTTAPVMEQAKSNEDKAAIVMNAISETKEVEAPADEAPADERNNEDIKRLSFNAFGTLEQLKTAGPKIKAFLEELKQKGEIDHYG